MRSPLSSTLCVILLSLILTLTVLTAVAIPLTVKTDKTTYRPGDIVTITIQGKPDTQYAVEVRDPANAPVGLQMTKTDGEGIAVVKIGLPSDARTGTYTVYVSGGGEYSTTKFEVKIITPAPSPAPTVSPSAVAASKINTAKKRFNQLANMIFELNNTLYIVNLTSILSTYFSKMDELNSTLQEAENSMKEKDYETASSLASRVSSESKKLMNEILKMAVSALSELADTIRNSSDDELVTSLTDAAKHLIEEVTPTRIEDSVILIHLSAKILLASQKILNVTMMEATIDVLNTKLKEAQKLLNESINEINALKSRISLLEDEREKLSSSLNEAQSALMKAEEELKQLRQNYNKLQSEKEELKQKISELNTHLNTLKLIVVIVAIIAGIIGFTTGYLLSKRRSK